MDFLGPSELLIIGVIAVLLYGQRLPDVGRKVGRVMAEFKRSMQGFQDQINSATTSVTSSVQGSSSGDPGQKRYVEEVDDYEEATAPKFEPPKPVQHPPLPKP